MIENITVLIGADMQQEHRYEELKNLDTLSNTYMCSKIPMMREKLKRGFDITVPPVNIMDSIHLKSGEICINVDETEVFRKEYGILKDLKDEDCEMISEDIKNAIEKLFIQK